MLFFKLDDFARSSVGKRDLVVLVNFIASFVMNIAIWVVLILNFWGVNDLIIVQYNIYFGISALGSWQAVLAIPIIGLLAIVLNLFLALYFYLNYRIISYFLSFSTTILNIILLVAGLLLIYNNF